MATAKRQEREYPRKVWVLTGAYQVREVTVVCRRHPWSGTDYGDETETGKGYSVGDMHASKADAIAYGRKQIALREEYLEKQHALLDARRIKIDNAEKET